jgi:signal transduction histidine kinase
MSRPHRYYLVAGLVALLAALLLFVGFYREVAVQGIAQQAERINLTLARTALNSIKPLLLDYLRSTEHPRVNNDSHAALPPQLAEAIRSLMFDRAIVRVQIFNRHGKVVFSHHQAVIGSNQRSNRGFVSAINGRISNSLVYRDTHNSFDGVTEADNLMQTYLPVRRNQTEPVQGVFEIYTDANHLASQTEHTQFFVIVGALLILAAMNAAVVVVWRAGNLIELQQRTIRERTNTLEALSSHLLKNEELQKQKIALELHEGLAQTLSAIKLHIENFGTVSTNGKATDQSIEAIVPVLRDAIQEVRTIATELRPSSIDDFGLLLTLQRFCRAAEQQHPHISIDCQLSVEEGDIPSPAKIILYRIITSVLDDMVQRTCTDAIHLALWRDDRTLTLIIDDTAADALDQTAVPLANIDPQLSAGYARMEELTTLSGGIFSASHHVRGGTTLQARWNV